VKCAAIYFLLSESVRPC